MIEGVSLAAVRGAVPAAAVVCLGRRLACLVGGTTWLAPERVVVDGGGGVMLRPGPAAPRWRAPELRRGAAPSMQAALWSLGRLLLELALGRPVADALVDDPRVDELRALIDVDGDPLPDGLVELLMALLARSADRLPSMLAADRVFADAERRFGDGDAALAGVLARALWSNGSDVRRLGVGQPERTADLPVAAVLSCDELEEIAAPSGPVGVPVLEDIEVVVERSQRDPPRHGAANASHSAPNDEPTAAAPPGSIRRRQPSARMVLWILGISIATVVAVVAGLVAPLL